MRTGTLLYGSFGRHFGIRQSATVRANGTRRHAPPRVATRGVKSWM